MLFYRTKVFSNFVDLIGKGINLGMRGHIGWSVREIVEFFKPKQTSHNNKRRKYESRRGVMRITSVNEQLGTIQMMLQMQRFLSESEERSLLNGSMVFNR